ncbi:hypothetical protein GGI42DRAFT_59773 [Trichoderma sp. SZMC 28013]
MGLKLCHDQKSNVKLGPAQEARVQVRKSDDDGQQALCSGWSLRVAGSRTTAVALGSPSLSGLAWCRPPHAKAHLTLVATKPTARPSCYFYFFLVRGHRAMCVMPLGSCVSEQPSLKAVTPLAPRMLSYALLGIIINHPSPAPPLHRQRCLCAVLCLCCAVPSPLPPSAALVRCRLMVPFGVLPVWLGLDAPQGSVWFRRFGVVGEFCVRSNLYRWNIMS